MFLILEMPVLGKYMIVGTLNPKPQAINPVRMVLGCRLNARALNFMARLRVSIWSSYSVFHGGLGV